MNLVLVAKISLESMLANKLRTALTIIGIVIGIAGVIIVFSAGDGIKSLIYSQIESFGGTDLIQTEIKLPTGRKGAAAERQSALALAQGVQITTLTLQDMADVLKLPNIKNGYGAIIGQEQVSYGNSFKQTIIFGASASFIEIDKAEIDYGRFYSESEDKAQAPVVVLGSKIKNYLFGEVNPLGKYIKIRNVKFTVIGVIKERGAIMGMDFDDFVYMPVQTLQKRVMGINHIIMMLHQVYDKNRLEETAEEIRLVLRQNHNLENRLLDFSNKDKVKNIGESMTDTSKDDFRVVTMAESMEILSTVTWAVTLLLLAIVAISLLVGGVGIMNIMYVSVTERTPEIGLRKAVGATYKDIMFQFLAEAIIITLVAGIIGIAVGFFVSFLIALTAKAYGLDWRFSVSFQAVVIAFLFATFCGLVFGIYPAQKAAKLEAIEALRSE